MILVGSNSHVNTNILTQKDIFTKSSVCPTKDFNLLMPFGFFF